MRCTFVIEIYANGSVSNKIQISNFQTFKVMEVNEKAVNNP